MIAVGNVWLPLGDGTVVSDESPWWPSGKVFGHYLSPCLAQLEPARAAA